MQTLPQTDKRHLSHDAALMLLAVLPDHIRDAYLNHAKQTDYAIELVLEMALADFLDPDSLTFTDCKPQIGLPLNSDQVT
ncbi:MAG: hypothetical protein NW224_12695 [Leptolyngbyaceae cyanobacterium bins.302]|nr:hypothetical protein [Leptolyngbyaceae cyanobacterium bins.302]